MLRRKRKIGEKDMLVDSRGQWSWEKRKERRCIEVAIPGGSAVGISDTGMPDWRYVYQTARRNNSEVGGGCK